MTQPTLTVELGYLSGWTLGTSLLGTSTYLATVSYSQDISADVRSVSIRRGRQHELNRVEAGTASIMVINQDGAMTRIPPMTSLRIRAIYGPGQLAGLVAWYDYADSASLWKDTARTVPVTADGDVIKGVTDKSNAGRHLTEATNGPAYKVAIQNGQSGALFDGTNDILTYTGAVVTQPNTIIVAGKRIAGGSSHFLDGTTARQIVGMPGGAFYGIFAGTTLATSTAIDTTARVLAGVFNGASSEVWLDGGAGVIGNAGTNALTDIVQSNAAFTNADLFEVVIYNRALSLAEINFVGSDLGSKWGTTWTTAT